METDVTEKAVSSALEFLLKDSKTKGSLNRWCFVSPEGKASPDYGPCLASLTSSKENKKITPPTGCLAVTFNGGKQAVSRIQFGGYLYNYDEDSKDFIEFLVGPESPWRSSLVPFLVQKDPLEIFKSRGFIFGNLSEINYLLLQNFLIASRMCFEFPKKFQTMKSLISEGISEFDSYITAQSFSSQGDGQFNFSYQGGHEPFSSFEIENLISRLRSGETNGVFKSFYGGSVQDPLSLRIPAYFSSPFWSSKRVLLDGIQHCRNYSIEDLKEYAMSLQNKKNIPEPEPLNTIEKPEIPKLKRRGFRLKIQPNLVEIAEEIDF